MLNIYFAKSFLYNCADKISGEFFILFYFMMWNLVKIRSFKTIFKKQPIYTRFCPKEQCIR